MIGANKLRRLPLKSTGILLNLREARRSFESIEFLFAPLLVEGEVNVRDRQESRPQWRRKRSIYTVLIHAVALALLIPHIGRADAHQTIAAELRGRWATSLARCKDDALLSVNDSTVKVHHKAFARDYRKFDECRSCVGGVRYSGIGIVYSFFRPDADDPDLVILFNADEKKGTARIEAANVGAIPLLSLVKCR